MNEEEISKAIAAYFHDLTSGICPTCKAKVEREEQVGRCVYASPCGHRLFQGNARSTPVQEPEPPRQTNPLGLLCVECWQLCVLSEDGKRWLCPGGHGNEKGESRDAPR